ncbi:MAG: 1,2-diacylglycerol 3-glucosyltransferase, partial [Eubacterium sp.]
KTTAELLIAIESLKGNEVKQYAMKSALKKMYYGHAAESITTDIISRLDSSNPVLDTSYNENGLFLLKEN